MDIFKKFSGYVYVGRATMRTEEEPSIQDLADGKEQLIQEYPEAIPHIFLRYQDLSLGQLIMTPKLAAKGYNGVIVKFQKILKKEPVVEVEAWRESFTPDALPKNVKWLKGSEEAVQSDIEAGAPFVLLDAEANGLDIPMTVDLMRKKINEIPGSW